MGHRALGYTGCAEIGYTQSPSAKLTRKPVYIPRSILMLLVIIYLLFLLTVDWINAADELWYRPFVVAFIVVLVARWAHRDQETDEPE